MKTITAKITGRPIDLEMVSTCAISSASVKRISGNVLTAIWICEENDYTKALEDCMESVNIQEIENFDCELLKMY